MKTRFLIIIGIVVFVAGFAIYTSGAFTPLQSDLTECYYTDDQSNTPQPCMIIDGWYDMLQESSLRISSTPCGDKYLKIGKNECVLNPEFIESNTIIIYDVLENSRTRLAITPHHLMMNLTGSDTVMFVNQAANSVNIFVSDGTTAMPLFGNTAKNILSFENVNPSSQRTLIINGTGYYQFLIQDSRHGRTGEIVVLSDETNSLPVEIKAKMAQTIVGGDFRKDVGLISVGSGGAEPGITIGIHEKFKDEPNAEQFYYEKYKNMIPFDVPIWIEFRAPITLTNG